MGQRYYSSSAQRMALTAGVASSDLSIGVDMTSGLPTSTPFTLIIDPGKPSEEVVTVSAVSGNTLTVIRGEDGTAAQAHTTGAEVMHGLSARDLREPQVHMNASMGVHGLSVTDTVAGVTATQTLKNKSISGVDNTLSNIPQSAVVGLTTLNAAAQTLTNKTMSGDANTFTNIPQSAVTGIATVGIPDAADLNTYATQGRYAQSTTSWAVNGSNYPVPLPGMLEVGTQTTDFVYQRYTTFTFGYGLGNRVYTRMRYVTTWGAWREVGGVAPGSITMFAGVTAPEGWLLCDGSTVSRTIYADLYAVLGIAYGSGDGSTTFGLPNLKGRVPVGIDAAQTEFNARAKTGGEKTHQLTVAEMPSHNHPLTVAGQPAVAGQGSASAAAGGSFFAASGGVTTITMGNTGGDGAHNNLQPYIALNFIIRA